MIIMMYDDNDEVGDDNDNDKAKYPYFLLFLNRSFEAIVEGNDGK